ncbi:RHS repeat-associated core domain-containing protein [Nitrosomonas europaea]|uniref:RHS repeat-associated core domain-containing protein n=1 Tax=Nitrosomonas europaea TaxID=915 RepID=UPI000793064A|nr:RHS repeat-associated core domain-containing protein [Nitrosomonas europaea]KXK48158.1 MAG: ParB-like nuclease domain-containing protein [Nitrosomonas europaea]
MAEYNSGGTLLRRYVHGPGVDEPLVWYEGTTTTNKTWLYQDQLGSVIGTANSAGTSTAIHSYGPYGEPNIATGIRFRYTGQQFLGSLNLYYYKARFYSPALGRFLQTDPIGTADDLNLYAYVGNNPINFNDPSGLLTATAGITFRIPGWISWLIPEYIGQGVSAGVAIQFTDDSGQFAPDLGVYWSGAAGGGDIGVGRVAANLGLRPGTIADLAGQEINISAHYGTYGLTVNLDKNNNFSGISADIGWGYNAGVAGSIGGSLGMRELFSDTGTGYDGLK